MRTYRYALFLLLNALSVGFTLFATYAGLTGGDAFEPLVLGLLLGLTADNLAREG